MEEEVRKCGFVRMLSGEQWGWSVGARGGLRGDRLPKINETPRLCTLEAPLGDKGSLTAERSSVPDLPQLRSSLETLCARHGW